MNDLEFLESIVALLGGPEQVLARFDEVFVPGGTIPPALAGPNAPQAVSPSSVGGSET